MCKKYKRIRARLIEKEDNTYDKQYKKEKQVRNDKKNK